jgi:hypothetical protein
MPEQSPAPNANREGQEAPPALHGGQQKGAGPEAQPGVRTPDGQQKGAGPEAQPGVRTPDGQIRTQGHAVEGQSTASSPHPSRPA